MQYAGVDCERVEPIAPEAYVCRWEDRLRLAVVLLHDGKGSVTRFRQRVKGADGIMARDFAYVEVNHYEPRG